MINDIKIMFFAAINALNMILGLTNVVMIFVRCDMIVRMKLNQGVIHRDISVNC